MSDDFSWITWYGQSRKRWPMTLGLCLGVAFAIYSTAAGYGNRLAQERLPITRAAVIARNQPPVADDRNAAFFYDKATAALVPWRKLDPEPSTPLLFDGTRKTKAKERDPDRMNSLDWRDEATFANDSPLRIYLHANEETVRLTLKATSLPEVDWGIPAEDFPKASITRVTNLRPLMRLLALRALTAAHDGRWPEALDLLREMEHGGNHARLGIGLLPYFTHMSISKLIWAQACDLLALPETDIDESSLLSLRALSVDAGISRLTDVHHVLTDEYLLCGHVMDQVACGDFTHITKNSDSDGLTRLPRAINLYSPIYPWERSAFDDTMLGAQESLLAQLENREPKRKKLDPEVAFHSDPRLVYSAIFGISLAGMLTPLPEMFVKGEEIRQDKWRILTTAIDVRNWIRQHSSVPTTLEETGLDADQLRDPFAKDQQLHMRREDDLLHLWSAGANGKDDTTVRSTKPNASNDDVNIFIRLPKELL